MTLRHFCISQIWIFIVVQKDTSNAIVLKYDGSSPVWRKQHQNLYDWVDMTRVRVNRSRIEARNFLRLLVQFHNPENCSFHFIHMTGVATASGYENNFGMVAKHFNSPGYDRTAYCLFEEMSDFGSSSATIRPLSPGKDYFYFFLIPYLLLWLINTVYVLFGKRLRRSSQPSYL